MLGTKTIDGKNAIDWGKTSEDYARYRPGPPISLYQKLASLDVGVTGQRILDLGTGTGVHARAFAKQGCVVTGADISPEQIAMAKELTQKEGFDIEFHAKASEEIDFPAESFDVITANQCYLYFDPKVVIPLIKKLLKPNGLFVTSHFSWMPFLAPIAKASEELILQHNPNWTAHSYKGDIPPFHGGLEKHFKLKAFFYYDEGIPFTRESWRGRIRACRGVAAALSPEQVLAFDQDHEKLLSEIADEQFEIIHRLDAHIMTID